MPGLIPDNVPATIADRIVLQMIEDVKGLTRSDDGSPLFKSVRRGDPDDMDITALQTPGFYLQDSDDNIDATLFTQNVVARELSLIAHIRFARGQQGVDPYRVFQYYRGELSKLLFQPDYLRKDAEGKNLALIIYEVGYNPEVFTQDAQQGGNIVLRAKYRHEKNNPHVSR